MRFLRRLWYMATRRRRDAELADEIALHREMKAQELRDRGVGEAGLDAATRRAIGNDLLAREQAHDVWVALPLQDVTRDVRIGLRMLLKERRFSAIAIVTLGLGIAVTNAVFTIVNATLFRDLPFQDADRLVTIRTQDPRGFPSGVSYQDYLDWQRQTTAFEEFCAEMNDSVALSDASQPAERLSATYVTHRLFRTLGVAPVLGRDFAGDDDREGAAGVVILSDSVWRGRYGADPAIVGRDVRVNEQPATVIGVMPERFAYPLVAELWLPLSMAPANRRATRASTPFWILGKLAPSIDLRQARSEIETIAARTARDHPETPRDRTLMVSRVKESYFAAGAGTLLLTLLGAGAVVLLIACANVANLLLARSWHRSREIAVRLALGATRWRVVRQLLIECSLIAAGAGVVGAYLSIFGVDAISRAFNVVELTAPDRPRRPYWFDPTMDGASWLFLGLACVVASVGAGLIPALHLSKRGMHDILKEGGRASRLTPRARRWAGALVVGQLALALMLLAGAVLFARAFFSLYYTDLIVDTRDVVVMQIALPQQKYGTVEQRQSFFRRLDERLAATALFTASSLSSDVPLQPPFLAERRTLSIDGRDPVAGETPPRPVYVTVGPRYFETLKLIPTRGRPLSSADGLAGQEGAIVDERFASLFFPGLDVIGKRIRLAPTGPPGPWLTVVGVVPTLPDFLPNRPPDPVVYAPLLSEPSPPSTLAVILRAPSKAAAAATLREEVRRLDPDLPVFAIQTLDEALSLTRMGARMIGSWFQTLALIAVVLASVGLYALTAFGVSQRTQEIGVRMALGARPHQVTWLFVRRTILHLAIGLPLGLAGALLVGRLVAAFLGDTNPGDPATLILVSVGLAGVAIAASVWPARRAAGIDPAVALRTE